MCRVSSGREITGHLLVVCWALLVLAKDLDCGEALDAILGADALVVVVVAVNGAEAGCALQLLRRLLPLLPTSRGR